MTDDDKKQKNTKALDLGLEDLDWDAAIEEWEQSALTTSTKDAATSNPEALAHSVPASAPPADAPAQALYVQVNSRTTAPPPPGTEDPADAESDERSRALIARVPKDLHARATSGGGLGQLFKSRGSHEEEQEENELFDVLLEELQSERPGPLAPVQTAATEDELSETLVKNDDASLRDADLEHLPSQTQVASDLGLLQDASDPDDDGPPTTEVPNAPRPVHLLLRPHRRAYDPNEDTAEVSRELLEDNPSGRPRLPSRLPDDDATTGLRDKPSVRPFHPESIRGELPPAKTFDSERAAAAWMDEATRDAHIERASWLDEEARANADPHVCARMLLVVSELRALAGDLDFADRAAHDACELGPELPLTHWQARGLMPMATDTGVVLGALDAERHSARTEAAGLHAALLAAEHARAAGLEDEFAVRITEACCTPGDIRAPMARAASALGSGDWASAGLRDAPVPAFFEVAVATALRVRGAEGANVDAGAILPSESLRRARAFIKRGDLASAATLVAELRAIPELSRGAAWLAAALATTRPESRASAAKWLTLLSSTGDVHARRALSACGVELGDAAMVDSAIEGEIFSLAERGVLSALMKLGGVTDLDAIARMDGMAPLAAALGALSLPADTDERAARAACVAGSDSSRARVSLGRLLAGDAKAKEIDAAIFEVAKDMPDSVRPLGLEMAWRSGRFDQVSEGLGSWADADEREKTAARDRHLAAALIAERAGDKDRALLKYRNAYHADRTCDAALRAMADLAPNTDLVHELGIVADELGDGLRGALARIEAVTRANPQNMADIVRAEYLERAHHAWPQLPLAAFLAEHLQRASGNVDEVLKWIRLRRAASHDPLQVGLDAVREALLVAARDPNLARERISEAHHAHPTDVALRDLFERHADPPAAERGAWREKRAESARGAQRALLFTQAAQHYDRAGDTEAVLRTAQAARAAGESGLGRFLLERAEIECGAAAGLADELLTLARTTENARDRREAYERLADLDTIGRSEASALLWHKTILEQDPGHKPSLRYVEQVLVAEGREEELEPIFASIAKALSGSSGGECGAHAEVATRWRLRAAAAWESTQDLVDIAVAQPETSLWALRMANGLARARHDDAAILSSTLALIARASRTEELATLHLRAGEAATRLLDFNKARVLLERAAAEDPGDIVTWGLLAEVRQSSENGRGAADAGESLARTSAVPEHQLLAWYDSARLWLEADEADRSLLCFEQAAAIDVTYEDVFERLSTLYRERGLLGELAALLEQRIAKSTDPDDRVTLEVERARALITIGDLAAARTALSAALASSPDHSAALSAFGDLAAMLGDWDAAEKAWVRLVRTLNVSEEQASVYARLGNLYAVHAVNLSRAEVAFKELLKRAPNDVPTLERLVDIHRRQNDAARAVEVQQELVALAATVEEKRSRLVQLSQIFDETAHEPRKAEQVLEAARREFPGDVSLLRALAEFYARHRQLPAVNILLDRAATDARRAFLSGKFLRGHFEVLSTVFDLRGKKDAAAAIMATFDALEGRAVSVRGAEIRACDPRLDDLLAPEVLSDGLRGLLYRTGDALDAISPLDLRALHAVALPASAAKLQTQVQQLATNMGLGQVQILLSPQLGQSSVPASSAPPTIIVGEGLLTASNDLARTFLLTRTLKLVHARASILARTSPSELAVIISAWLQVFNPTWAPQGTAAAGMAEVTRRLRGVLPKQLDPDLGVIALEVTGSIGTDGATLGTNAMTWANRVALLAVGDVNAALDAIAWSLGAKKGAPAATDGRKAWCANTLEIKDIIFFSATDAYAEARTRLGLTV